MVDEKYLFCVPQKALIEQNGKILIVKRSEKTKSYPGHWDFPGGKLEHGENFDQSLVREVKEETSMGIFVEESEFIYVEKEFHAYVVLFNCEKAAGDVKLSDEHELPVYVFTDGDPYGYLNIYRTLKVGSGNAAHINDYFCVPKAKFLGVTPQDIIDYKLPTHPLKDIDLKRIKDGLKNDPFVQHHKEWQKALHLMAQLKKRAEQQAFSSKNLNYVLNNYLPDKLKNGKTWLP